MNGDMGQQQRLHEIVQHLKALYGRLERYPLVGAYLVGVRARFHRYAAGKPTYPARARALALAGAVEAIPVPLRRGFGSVVSTLKQMGTSGVANSQAGVASWSALTPHEGEVAALAVAARSAASPFGAVLVYSDHGSRSQDPNVKAYCFYHAGMLLLYIAAVEDVFGEMSRSLETGTADMPGWKLLRDNAASVDLHAAAMRYVVDAIAFVPDFSEALLIRGRLRAMAGGLDEAIADFRMAVSGPKRLAIELNDLPVASRAHYECGKVLGRLGRDDEALAEFSAATAVAAHNGRAWLKLADIYRRQGQMEQAARCQSRALHQDASRAAPMALPTSCRLRCN